MSDIPAGWEQTRLGDLGRYINGRGFKSSEWSDSGRPIIRIQNLTGSSSTVNYYAGEVEQRYIVEPGDLLISWAATLGAYFWSGSQAVLNQHIFRVESYINKRFHKYLVDHVLRELMNKAHGSGMVHITRKPFDETPVLLPPLAEQVRIVAAIEEQFSRLDAGMMALERVRQGIKRIHAAVLESAIRGRLLDTSPASGGIDDASSPKLPSDWSVVYVDDIAEVAGGITKNPKRSPRKNAIPFLSVANVLRDRLDLSDVHYIEVFDGELERLRLRSGDLLVVEGNGSPDQIGRSALWDGCIDPCVHQNHLIRVRAGSQIMPQYLNMFWNAPSSMAKIQAAASSTTGLHTLSTGKVRGIQVVLPPIPMQQRIVEEVGRQLSALGILDRHLATAQKRGRVLRSAILAAAFSGNLVPQDPSDDPAAHLIERIAVTQTSSNAKKPTRTRRPRTPRKKATA